LRHSCAFPTSLFDPFNLLDSRKTRVVASGIDIPYVLHEVRFRYHNFLSLLSQRVLPYSLGPVVAENSVSRLVIVGTSTASTKRERFVGPRFNVMSRPAKQALTWAACHSLRF
jgi:hypothetical protein